MRAQFRQGLNPLDVADLGLALDAVLDELDAMPIQLSQQTGNPRVTPADIRRDLSSP